MEKKLKRREIKIGMEVFLDQLSDLVYDQILLSNVHLVYDTYGMIEGNKGTIVFIGTPKERYEWQKNNPDKQVEIMIPRIHADCNIEEAYEGFDINTIKSRLEFENADFALYTNIKNNTGDKVIKVRHYNLEYGTYELFILEDDIRTAFETMIESDLFWDISRRTMFGYLDLAGTGLNHKFNLRLEDDNSGIKKLYTNDGAVSEINDMVICRLISLAVACGSINRLDQAVDDNDTNYFRANETLYNNIKSYVLNTEEFLDRNLSYYKFKKAKLMVSPYNSCWVVDGYEPMISDIPDKYWGITVDKDGAYQEILNDKNTVTVEGYIFTAMGNDG